MTPEELNEIEARCNAAQSASQTYDEWCEQGLGMDFACWAVDVYPKLIAEVRRLKQFESADIDPCEFCGNNDGFDDEGYCNFCSKKVDGYCCHCDTPMDEFADSFLDGDMVCCSEDCVQARIDNR